MLAGVEACNQPVDKARTIDDPAEAGREYRQDAGNAGQQEYRCYGQLYDFGDGADVGGVFQGGVSSGGDDCGELSIVAVMRRAAITLSRWRCYTQCVASADKA